MSLESLFEDIVQKPTENLFEELETHLGKEMKVTGLVSTGKFSEAWDEVKSAPGEHQRKNSENMADMGISENWASQNSDGIAAAIVAMFFSGGSAGGAAGGAGGGEAGVVAGEIGTGVTAGEAASGAGSASSGSTSSTEGGGVGDFFGDMFEDTDWLDMIGQLFDDSGGQQTQQQQRNYSYSDLIGRLNRMTSNEMIDPMEEIIIPTGARYG